MPSPAGFYAWRDPARVTPARRAQLAAHDARDAEPEPKPSAAGRHQAADSRRKQEAFAAARDRGATIREAAAAAGIAYGTAKRYDRARKETTS